MRKLSAWALIFLLTFTLCLPVLRAETEDEIWTLVTQEGIALTRIGTKVSVGDEYISGDNTVYRVISVDEVKREATVAPIGEEAALTQAFFLVQPVAMNLTKSAMGRLLLRRAGRGSTMWPRRSRAGWRTRA